MKEKFVKQFQILLQESRELAERIRDQSEEMRALEKSNKELLKRYDALRMEMKRLSKEVREGE